MRNLGLLLLATILVGCGDDEVVPIDEEAFVEIKAGSFMMGSPMSELRRDPNERIHEVRITSSFLMGKAEVSFSEWREVRAKGESLGYTDIGSGEPGRSGSIDNDYPVVAVSWIDVLKWCNLRSELEGREPVYSINDDAGRSETLRVGVGVVEASANWSANGYRLPREAEWEFACRAGTETAFYSGGISRTGTRMLDERLNVIGWYGGNTKSCQQRMTKKPNAWGLYDMHGNVAEWCWDYLGEYAESTDPVGPDSGRLRVHRGGFWTSFSEDCRSARRLGLFPISRNPRIGFRLVLNAD